MEYNMFSWTNNLSFQHVVVLQNLNVWVTFLLLLQLVDVCGGLFKKCRWQFYDLQ